MATSEPTDLRPFAALVIDVLHIGEKKADRLATDVCAAFGIDLGTMLAQPGGFAPEKVARIKAAVTEQLVDRCSDAETMLRAFVRSGAQVVAMVDEIYRLLAEHDATTGGTSDPHRFHLQGGDLDLTLSQAFVEELRELVRSLVDVELGEVDTEQLRLLLGPDDGESYGSFPTDGAGGRPLLHEVMLLRPIRSKLQERAAADARWDRTLAAHDRASAAADRLLDRLEDVLRGFAAGIIAPEEPGDERTVDEELLTADWERGQRDVERSTLTTDGVIGGPVYAGYFDELDGPTFVGVRLVDADGELLERPVPMRSEALVDRRGHFTSALGSYVGLIRGEITLSEDRWSEHDDSRGEAARVLGEAGPEEAITWLDSVAGAAEAATSWIDGGLWIRTGSRPSVVHHEVLEQVLNLPLWSKRGLLFEIWLLCRTLRAAEADGWTFELAGLDGQTWILPSEKAAEPVAHIERGGTTLSIWREPDRGVTPDLAIATTGPWAKDLVVIEAKDRHPMHTGIGPDGVLSEDVETASGTAIRYVRTVGAQLTWVCNHSPSKGARPEPEDNIGTPWHQVHLAAELGPRTVPTAFDRTIADVLSPRPVGIGRRLVLVLDTTASMHSVAGRVGASLEAIPPDWCDSFAALLVGDHGDDEPYVVHPVDAHRTPQGLWDAIVEAGQTGGGDVPEALEDAMHHARLMSTGPTSTFVVVTDAPPHAPHECPEHLDFAEEVAGILDRGASIWVISDFLGEADDVWAPFVDSPRLRFLALDDLAAALDPSAQPSRPVLLSALGSQSQGR